MTIDIVDFKYFSWKEINHLPIYFFLQTEYNYTIDKKILIIFRNKISR